MNITNIEGINGKTNCKHDSRMGTEAGGKSEYNFKERINNIKSPAEGLDFISKYLIIKQLENQYPW